MDADRVWVLGEVTGVQEPAEQAVLNRKAGEIGKGRGPAVIPTAFPAVWLRLQPRKFHAMPPRGLHYSTTIMSWKYIG